MMKAKMLKEIQRSLIKNFLDTVVMAKLKRASEPMNGYEFVEYVQQRYGILISAGTMYTMLYYLERQGMLKGEWRSGKRVYSLTAQGGRTVDKVMDSREEIQRFLGTLLED
jgi:DNA-binding PadR family transcriptional regulator